MAWGDGWGAQSSAGVTPNVPLMDWLRPSSSLTNDLYRTMTAGTTTVNNQVLYGRSDYDNATISVYLDGSLQGTTTTAVGGSWNYALALLTDAAHTLVATVTVLGVTSNLSTPFTFTVTPGLTNLTVAIGSNIPDNDSFRWDGWQCATESNRSGPVNNQTDVPIDTHTLRKRLLGTDDWLGYNRNELIFGVVSSNQGTIGSEFQLGQTLNLTFEFMLSASSPVNDSTGWCTMGQIHDTTGTPGALNTAIYGGGLGDLQHVLALGDVYSVAYKSGTNANTYPWETAGNIARGVFHKFDLICKMQTAANGGLLKIWFDGVQVVNGVNIDIYATTNTATAYHWKMGIYRGPFPGGSGQTQIADYRNFRMIIQ